MKRVLMQLKFKSKEELYKYLEEHDLYGLDSEYSSYIKDLKNKFNANGVYLNKWCVMTHIKRIQEEEWTYSQFAPSEREII